MTINEYLDRYLDINPVGYSKMNKQKYENNVDKDYPGLRKLIDTLDYYYETINYKKTYIFPETEKGSLIDWDDSDSYSDSDSDSDSDRDDYYSKEELKQFLSFKNGLDSDIGSDINFDSDSDSD